MTTRAKLASLGVTMTQAHDFIMANLGSPATIYQVAVQFKINSQMLADIVSIDFPGLSAGAVEAFFAGQGFSASDLRSPNYGGSSNLQLMPGEFSAMSTLVRPNERTGDLSNEAIRAKVAAKTGLDTYKLAFAPFNFKGNEDGVLSGQDLGVSGLANITNPTWEKMESLWMGTALNMLEAIDVSEMERIDAFTTANETLLDKDDEPTLAQLRTMVIDMFNTPAENPDLTRAEMVDTIVSANQNIVQLIGLNNESHLLYAFIGDIIGA
jgi:hypothetical protein